MGIFDRIFKGEVNIEKLENNREVEKLITLLKQKLITTNDLEVRVKAALALSRIGDQRGIMPISDCLDEITSMQQQYTLRGNFDFREAVLATSLIAARHDLLHARDTLNEKISKQTKG
jgi:HEAT repeat protein